ncbi:uncharacterized protein LOC135385148 [Ornithodoros turicata]|uniref:uncharacterized protein LOC135385148 n=1 Tax=Ornithodoros turicata TaxID=34597 RepID=UPI0031391754
MALVDAVMKLLYVDVGRNGRMNDAGIWSQSSMKEAIESGNLRIPGPQALPHSSRETPSVLVGDEGFGLKTYLMRPYPSRDLHQKKRVFNYRLSRARRIVENAFGLPANRWQIFRAPIRHQPERVIAIVKAAVALHNLLRSKTSTRALYSPPDSIDAEDVSTRTIRTGTLHQTESVNQALQKPNNVGCRCSQDAAAVRDTLKEYFFDEGAVSWQWKFT